jgi:uncharacterized membrane protein YidH (DUF202 family)
MRKLNIMASTIAGSPTGRVRRSHSQSSSRSDISPRRYSPSRTPCRHSTISFSEDARPNHPSTNELNDIHTADETPNDGQDHDRESDQPSSRSSTSNSSQDLKQPWYRKIASNYRSISLENKGSVARDHLALERTFLAWLRTSLAFASIGIAITQLFRLNTSLAEQKQRRKRDLDHFKRGKEAESLPLSPLMGASLTPDIYQNIQTLLQQQEYPIYAPSKNSASTLLDQLLRPTEFDRDAAARLRHLGKPLGATFLGISIVILFIGFHRYFESQHWIIRGQFPASRGSVALVGLIAVTLIVASLIVVLVVAPAAYNT